MTKVIMLTKNKCLKNVHKLKLKIFKMVLIDGRDSTKKA